jgi:transposase
MAMTQKYQRRDFCRHLASLPALSSLPDPSLSSTDQSESSSSQERDGNSWLWHGYDGRNTRHNPNTTAPRTGVTERWRKRIDGKYTERHAAWELYGLSSPVVTDDTLYASRYGKELVARNRGTGALEWRHQIDLSDWPKEDANSRYDEDRCQFPIR